MKTLLLAWLISLGAAASADDIVVLSTTGLTSTLDALSPTFEARSGHHLIVTYATTSQLKTRIDAGEPFDLCILTAPVVDALIKSGKALGGRTDIARSAIGVAVKKGASKPDISTAEAFKQTLLQATSVAFTSTGASGTYFLSVAERLGIGEAIKAKAHTTPGGPAGDLVAKGEAELAIQMISELLPVAGIDLVGPLPPELQNITVFAAGVSATAANPAGAAQLAAYLTSPDAIAAISAEGHGPGMTSAGPEWAVNVIAYQAYKLHLSCLLITESHLESITS